MMKKSQEMYKMLVAKHSEEEAVTIRAGRIHTISLKDANCGDEASEFLTKLLATSKQVFGLHHKSPRVFVNNTDFH